MSGLDLFFGMLVLAVIAAIVLVVFCVRAIVKCAQARKAGDEEGGKWYAMLAVLLGGIAVVLLFLFLK